MAQRKNQGDKFVEFVKLLQERGPEIASIARELGEKEETVRYWYKEKLVKKRFVVQAAPDYQKLGLGRMIVLASVGEAYMPLIRRVFDILTDYAYVVHYGATVPDSDYVISASVPLGMTQALVDFFISLRDRGIFNKIKEVYTFDWFRNVPMRADLYDFDKNRWETTSVSPKPVQNSAYRSSQGIFDTIDLQIIQQQQIDARVSISQIARTLGLDYRRALRHLKHTQSRGLIQFYKIGWTGTEYVQEVGRALTARHVYLDLILLIQNISPKEMWRLRNKLLRMPFVWGEAGGRDYFCQMFIPLYSVNEVLESLRGVLSSFKGRLKWILEDQGEATAFVIAANLYDQKLKRWIFNPSDALAHIDELLLMEKQRETTGRTH